VGIEAEALFVRGGEMITAIVWLVCAAWPYDRQKDTPLTWMCVVTAAILATIVVNR
jgi:hypothetical protein